MKKKKFLLVTILTLASALIISMAAKIDAMEQELNNLKDYCQQLDDDLYWHNRNQEVHEFKVNSDLDQLFMIHDNPERSLDYLTYGDIGEREDNE